ncbi:MAG TPA: VOC family protein [Terriglobales bacterium]|nr:VOC family protein [Terriglobales bacterium]
MPEKVTPIPEGFHSVTPSLTVHDAKKAIEFYKKAFNAEPREVHYTPDGKVMHATLKIGDSLIMLVDEFPEWGSFSPQSKPGAGFSLHIYVPNVDEVYDRAVKAGATVEMPLADQFWGDRYGKLADPFGHKWSVGTRVKEMSPQEVESAAKAFFSGMAKTA